MIGSGTKRFAQALSRSVTTTTGVPRAISSPASASFCVTMPAAGQLFLGINDDDVNDNQGGFRVNIQRSSRR